MRWLIVFILASIVFSALLPHLERFGIGKMPLDLRVRLFGRVWLFPFGSSVLLSLLAYVIARLI
ncbi:DUF2905 domain-containing protein [Thiomonas sp.]|jgi:hypothetical protein|uniref:DUF2905 domain-containing protein n=1 Tax=Thiomonas sp. TaxID=2047785 RepID=UPI0026213C15|nr:DUF2905 domain-containing protein [Thiomonas sp.]